MGDQKLYQQKKQAQLDAWKADIDKLKAKSAMMNADAKIKMNEHIKTLEDELEDGKSKLSELKRAAGNTYDSMKTNVETAWEAITTSFSDANKKFKK